MRLLVRSAYKITTFIGFLFAVAICLNLFTLPCQATPLIPKPCCPCTCTVMGEWIYYSAPSESMYYTNSPIQAGPLIVDGVNNMNPLDRHAAGYRVAMGYSFSNEDFLSLTFTSYRIQHRADVGMIETGPNAFIGDAPPSLFNDFPGNDYHSIQWHRLTYYALEAVVGMPFVYSKGIGVVLFTGVQYVHLYSKDVIDFLNPPQGATEVYGTHNCSIAGCGPEIGMHGDIYLFDKISFLVTSLGGFVVGPPRTETKFYTDEGNIWSSSFERIDYKCVPFNITRFGISYDFRVKNFGFTKDRLHANVIGGTLEFGYEFVVYFHALTVMKPFSQRVIADCLQDKRNVVLHGPYARLSFNF